MGCFLTICWAQWLTLILTLKYNPREKERDWERKREKKTPSWRQKLPELKRFGELCGSTFTGCFLTICWAQWPTLILTLTYSPREKERDWERKREKKTPSWRQKLRLRSIWISSEFCPIALAIDCSALGMGVATDRATRSVLPRAYALDTAADLRGRIFITSTTTRQNAPSPSCGVSLALDLRKSPLAACHGCSSPWLGPGHLMVGGDFKLWAWWATLERLWASWSAGAMKTVVRCGDTSRITKLSQSEVSKIFSVHTRTHAHLHTHTYGGCHFDPYMNTRAHAHIHTRWHNFYIQVQLLVFLLLLGLR